MLFVLFLMVGATALAEGDAGNETCLSSEKADYKDLKSEFFDDEDDYLFYKGKYRSASFDSEAKELGKYEYKLESLDEDLKDLRDDVRDLISDVEDKASCSGKSDLLDDLDDLKDDISDLREEIVELLAEEVAAGKGVAAAYVAPANYNSQLPVENKAATEKADVVVSTLSVGPKAPTAAAVVAVSENASSWQEMRQTVWLVAGLVVLLAVVLFLLGMLFR